MSLDCSVKDVLGPYQAPSTVPRQVPARYDRLLPALSSVRPQHRAASGPSTLRPSAPSTLQRQGPAPCVYCPLTIALAPDCSVPDPAVGMLPPPVPPTGTSCTVSKSTSD